MLMILGYRIPEAVTLKYPDQYCIIVGWEDAPQFLRAAVCWIEPGQGFHRPLSKFLKQKHQDKFKEVNREIRSYCNDFPKSREFDLLRLFEYSISPAAITSFNIRISKTASHFPSLPEQHLNTGKVLVSQKKKKGLQAFPEKLEDWNVLVIVFGRTSLSEQMKTSLNTLLEPLCRCGKHEYMAAPDEESNESPQLRINIQSKLKNLRKKTTLGTEGHEIILCVWVEPVRSKLPARHPGYHKDVKVLCDLELGLHHAAVELRKLEDFSSPKHRTLDMVDRYPKLMNSAFRKLRSKSSNFQAIIRNLVQILSLTTHF